MSQWVQESIEIAKEEGYLDRLQTIYAVSLNHSRTIPDEKISRIRDAYESGTIEGLIRELLDLEKFPIDDPYIGSFRAKPELIERNPETIERIGKKLLSHSFEELLSKAQEPKAPSRQLGNAFRTWLRSKGYKFLSLTEFQKYKCSDPIFLDGNDITLKKYISSKLGSALGDTRKGVDFVFSKGKKFCFGEAKFISTPGGTQTNQLDIALDIADMNRTSHPDIYSAAILDGIIWFYPPYLNKITTRSNHNVMTSLLFEKFVASF